MTEETLRQLLARVHERLSSSSTIDPEARDMLATVMRDIGSALGKGSAGGAPGKEQAAASGSSPVPVVAAVPISPEARVATRTPRMEILEALAVRFEAEHPAIAQLLRQIGALLGQAGI
jgi:D-aminopeptidase